MMTEFRGVALGLTVLGIAGCRPHHGGMTGTPIPIDDTRFSVDAGDLDNDKDLDDLALLDRDQRELTIFLDGATSSKFVYGLGKNPTDLVVADVTGDGWADVLIISFDAQQKTTSVQTWVNRQMDTTTNTWLGLASGFVSTIGGSTLVVLSAGDFDTKQGLDVFAYHPKSGEYIVLSNDGINEDNDRWLGFTAGNRKTLDPDVAQFVAVRELDKPAAGDPSCPDVILQTKAGGMQIHKNVGNGTFTPPFP